MKAPLIAAIATLTLLTNPATSQEVCYMQRSDGSRTNLEAICGGRSGRVAQVRSMSNNTSDAEFIAEYRRLATTQVQSGLILATFNRNPQQTVGTAKNICAMLRLGEPKEDLMETWIKKWAGSSPNVKEAGVESTAILFTLAPKYYCPEFSSLN